MKSFEGFESGFSMGCEYIIDEISDSILSDTSITDSEKVSRIEQMFAEYLVGRE